MTVAEVMAGVLAKDGLAADDGVTFSGGEPLMQPPFLTALLSGCRELGLHTAVDTCGFAPAEQLQAVAALSDLFLFDLKCLDAARHQAYTGVSNALILENLRLLGRLHARLWVRLPLVPGLNDDPAELTGLAQFVATIPGVELVQLLPYRPSGVQASRRSPEGNRLATAAPPAPPTLEAAAGRFRAAGVTATVLGAELGVGEVGAHGL